MSLIKRWRRVFLSHRYILISFLICSVFKITHPHCTVRPASHLISSNCPPSTSIPGYRGRKRRSRVWQSPVPSSFVCFSLDYGVVNAGRLLDLPSRMDWGPGWLGWSLFTFAIFCIFL
ncbi:hypothetical protein F4808DRAFT_139484 [Astrocystis sublimbata]|nr:hypothetical protein F4808DRAFT_139484 [Astrocystis sublimbata]